MMISSISRRLSRLSFDRRGASAIEFAICAPVLLGGLIVMTDIGLALNERMNLDQAVRAGAEFVMNDVTDESDLEELVGAAATGYSSDDPQNVNSSPRPTVDVVMSCSCPGVTTPPSCSEICTSNERPPNVYYDISATKTYEAIFLPDFALRTQIRVQVR